MKWLNVDLNSIIQTPLASIWPKVCLSHSDGPEPYQNVQPSDSSRRTFTSSQYYKWAIYGEHIYFDAVDHIAMLFGWLQSGWAARSVFWFFLCCGFAKTSQTAAVAQCHITKREIERLGNLHIYLTHLHTLRYSSFLSWILIIAYLSWRLFKMLRRLWGPGASIYGASPRRGVIRKNRLDCQAAAAQHTSIYNELCIYRFTAIMSI